MSDAFARRVANVRSPMLRDEFAVDAAAVKHRFVLASELGGLDKYYLLQKQSKKC